MKTAAKGSPFARAGAPARRLLSALLALVMLLGLVPLWALPARAASGTGVDYDPQYPEVAILNRYTGNNDAFYKKLLVDTTDTSNPYRFYNGVTLFRHQDTQKSAQYSDRAEGNVTWDFWIYETPVLESLIKTSKNLEVNASATFYNRTHTHTDFDWSTFKNWEVQITSFHSMSIGVAGCYSYPILGGNKDTSRKYPRIGNPGDGTGGGYKTLTYFENNNYCRLHFYPSVHQWTDFKERECTCGGTYAEKVLVTFRDTRTPQLVDMKYRINDGEYYDHNKGAYVGAGSTVYIKLIYDEPIRFYDDSAAKKDQLCLGLQVDRGTTAYQAKLVELKDNYMVFSYTLPDSQKTSVEIAAIDMSSLFPFAPLEDMKQVGPEGGFTVDQTGEGFTTSSCYITDLAGNPLRKETIPSPSLTLDGERSFVEKVEFHLETNNADVKEVLGKTDPDDKDYTDPSDTHLGVGDSFYLIAYMNERLTGIAMTPRDPSKKNSYYIDWQHAVFTTNIKDANNNDQDVTVRSAYFYPFYDYDKSPTRFVTERITIKEGYYLPEGETIQITGMKFEKKAGEKGELDTTVTDLAGNPLKMDDVDIRATQNGQQFLDVTPPEVTVDGGYTPEEETAGFRYGVKLSDAESGYEDLNGSFILNNNGDGKAYAYEWAVTMDPETTEKTKWTDGVTGVAYPFEQTGTVYFHIRPKTGETYADFSNCTITVKARDYAGNVRDVTLPTDTDAKIPWYIDNLPPTVAAGAVSRKLNDDNTGTLTVNVTLSDSQGISAWQYAWSKDADTAPADDDSAWKDGGLVGGVVSPVTETVASDSEFSGYLWVKATDASGNANESAAACLGWYSYDLTAAKYALEYSSDITSSAKLSVVSIESGDCLYFLLPLDNTGTRYAAAFGFVHNNMFETTGWYSCTLAMDGSKYVLTKDDQDADMNTLLDAIRKETFTGALSVKVLAGKHDALTGNEGNTVITLGNEQYHFTEETITLRVSGKNPESNYENGFSLTANNLAEELEKNASGLLSTLENLSFTVTIGADKLGWKHEDIDWQSSYILLFNETLASEAEGKETRYYLGPIGNTDNEVKQTIVIGKEPSATGRYKVELYIAFRSGGSTTVELGQKIYVDATRPDDDFQFQPISYDILANYHGRNPYGLKDYYGIEGVKEIDKNAEGVYILPLYGYGLYDFTGSSGAVSYYGLSVKCGTGTTPGSLGDSKSYGEFSIVMWNTADPKVKLTLRGDTAQQEFTNVNPTGFVFSQSAADEMAANGHECIYLEPGEVNTVAIQKVYANGAASSVKYVRIKPVNDGVDGTAEAKNGKLVFTPKRGAVITGLKVFAWAWQNSDMGYAATAEDGKHYLKGAGQRIELTAQADGTWTADLLPNGANYRIFTESANGTLYECGSVSQRAPWFDDFPGEVDFNNDLKPSGIEVKDNKDGTYTMTFAVRDDYDTMKDGLGINIGLTFTGTDAEYAANRSFTYKNDGDSWAASGVEATGIYSITTEKYVFPPAAARFCNERDILVVTVTGVYPKGYDTMDVTVTATDAFGNAGTAKSENNTVSYVAITVGEHAPVMDGGGLAISFTQPVRPVESWAWHEKDDAGFRTYWDGGAFPIPGNGTWDIQYRDIFGNVYGRKITTDAFTVNGEDLSIDLGFSTTDVTKDPVILTTNATFGVIRVWEQNPGGETTLPDLNNLHAAQKRQTKFEANAEVRVRLYDDSSSGAATRLSLRVYIDNIVSGAPAAEVHYYVEQLGQEFTQEELDDYAKNGGTITGNVRAWYTTSRRVTPIDDTVSEFVFTPGGATSYTFKYQDDLGWTDSVTAELPDGLTLNAPAKPVKDTTPPDVSVDVYIKRGGAYTLAASFQPGDNVAAKLDALGYVQEYSLTIHASDASGFVIEATGEGTTLTGNVLTITKPGKDVTITVTDKSENQNSTRMTFTVPAKIDTTAPILVGDIAIDNISLYEKLLTLVFTDYDDSDNETVNGTDNTVFPVLPSGMATVSGKNRFTYKVTENGTVQIAFRDMAGNVWEREYPVTGIDTNPPELTTRWSPSETKDADTPPKGPVNTNVTAHIDSDKAMSGLTVKIGDDVPIELLRGGKWAYKLGEEYIIAGQNNAILATISATPERVTVTYFQDYAQEMTFTATAPNGRSTTAVLNGPDGVIDKDAPLIDETQDPMRRKIDEYTEYEKPYAVKVTLLPNEKVTSPNYGGWRDHEVTDSEGNVVGTVRRPDTYQPGTPGNTEDPEVPLVLTFTANGTYNVRFVDEAGNVTVHTVTIDSIDNTAPKLTVGTPDTSAGTSATVDITVNEPCTVTWGEGENDYHTFDRAGTEKITLGDNGTYLFVATDKAGNKTVQSLKVRDIDNIAPSISFDYGTIYVLKGDRDSLSDQLAAGYTVWDNVTDEATLKQKLSISGNVDIYNAGEYTAVYTVTDDANNVTTATRIVRVIGEDTVCLKVDGKLILPDSTAVLRLGDTHTLELMNNGTEPYTIKARAGVLSAGQMKYLSGSSLTFGEGGTFTVTTPGYYTLLVTTQSRQTIRILLYVEL